MKILVVYGTTEGQTRKIARFMEDALQEAGHQVVIADATEEPPAPMGFDAVLIGGSLHIHKFQSAVTHYISRHVYLLNQMPGAFFSVCLAAASDQEEERKEARDITRNFLEESGWEPKMTLQVAGALKYTQYDFFKRFIMRRIAKKEGRSTDTSQDYEYTDWEEVKAFVLDFALKAGCPKKEKFEKTKDPASQLQSQG